MAKDLSDMAKDDIETFKRYRGQGISDTSVTKLMEMGFWGGVGIAGLFMLAAMPFTGPGKAIPSEVWLAVSVGGITVFGVLALLMRQLPNV